MIWKVIAIIIDLLEDSIKLHDVLNGFIAWRVTHKDILETKILQEIVVI